MEKSSKHKMISMFLQLIGDYCTCLLFPVALLLLAYLYQVTTNPGLRLIRGIWVPLQKTNCGLPVTCKCSKITRKVIVIYYQETLEHGELVSPVNNGKKPAEIVEL